MSKKICPTLIQDKALGLTMIEKDKVAWFIHTVLPEVDVKRVKIVERVDLETMKEAERVVLRFVVWDIIGNMYGLIVQIGSEYPGDNILEIANEYQQEIIFGGLGYKDDEFRDSYVVIFCHNDPFDKGELIYNFEATKQTVSGKLSKAPYIKIINAEARR